MRGLTEKQRRSLEEYAALTITLDQLKVRLRGALDIRFSPEQRSIEFHYDNREPVVHIEMRHIQEAMNRHRRGEITTEQLSEWGAMLLANPSFDWAGPDEQEIADWLNEISLLTLQPKPEQE